MTIILLLAAFVIKADDFSLVHRLNSGKVDIYLQNTNALGAGVHPGEHGATQPKVRNGISLYSA
jgi:hypothetical protein